MCGRFTLTVSADKIRDFFPLFDIPDTTPRYNIAPTQPVLAVRKIEGLDRPQGAMLRWGLIPFWADDKKIGSRLINARAESVATTPAFRAAFRSRRCLVLADGFYEWQQLGSGKQPYHLRFQDRRPFAFAGLWDKWDRQGEQIESCTIITTDADDVVRPLHDRMPVIIPPDSFERWLDPRRSDAADLDVFLKPLTGQEMGAFPVSTMVNNVRNDDPRILEETSPQPETPSMDLFQS